MLGSGGAEAAGGTPSRGGAGGAFSSGGVAVGGKGGGFVAAGGAASGGKGGASGLGGTGGGKAGSGGLGGAPGTGGAIGAGGTASCTTQGANCVPCCKQMLGGVKTFSIDMYECGCSVPCYSICSATQCDIMTPDPSVACLACMKQQHGSMMCAPDEAKCAADPACRQYMNCTFGCF
jgi:hypothetical protein